MTTRVSSKVSRALAGACECTSCRVKLHSRLDTLFTIQHRTTLHIFCEHCMRHYSQIPPNFRESWLLAEIARSESPACGPFQPPTTEE